MSRIHKLSDIGLMSVNTVLVFDFDGVLFDTNRLKEKIFIEIAEDLQLGAGTIMRNILEKTVGAGREIKFSQLLTAVGIENKMRLLQLCQSFSKKFIDCAPMIHEIPEVIELVRYAKELEATNIICSAGSTLEMEIILENHGLIDFFDRIYGSEETKCEVLKEIMTEYENHDIFFIGDQLSDKFAADTNGTQFVGFGPVFSDDKTYV